MDARFESVGWTMKIKRTLSDPLMALKMLLLCEDLTLAERRVGAALIDHRNHRTGRCDPGLDTLSRELNIGRRTVIRANAGLEKKGLLRKRRHGGYFHRNGYDFNWERFRDLHSAWERHRESVRYKRSRQNLSLCGCQASHLDGDKETTQTCLSNQSKETYVDTQQQHSRRNQLPEPSNRTGEVTRSSNTKSIVDERFHVKAANSRNAARDAAERRWNEALIDQFCAAPAVFGDLVEAIDSELSSQATDAELEKRGSGIHFLLHELDRRTRIEAANAMVPSGEENGAGNLDGEVSAVAAHFRSLNKPKDPA